jgi:hypothetical protein
VEREIFYILKELKVLIEMWRKHRSITDICESLIPAPFKAAPPGEPLRTHFPQNDAQQNGAFRMTWRKGGQSGRRAPNQSPWGAGNEDRVGMW